MRCSRRVLLNILLGMAIGCMDEGGKKAGSEETDPPDASDDSSASAQENNQDGGAAVGGGSKDSPRRIDSGTDDASVVNSRTDGASAIDPDETDGISTSISGTIAFRLAPQSGDTYSVTEGIFSGSSYGVAFSGTVSELINCSSTTPKTLSINGSYSYAETTYTFSGTSTGQYNSSSSSFTSGTWTVQESTSPYGGNGTWSANWIGL